MIRLYEDRAMREYPLERSYEVWKTGVVICRCVFLCDLDFKIPATWASGGVCL